MAKETELERLVVRIVGDDSDYVAKMEHAATVAGKFSRVSDEVEHAQRQVRQTTDVSAASIEGLTNQTTASSGAFGKLGMGVSRAGMMISAVSAPIGAAVSGMGRMAVMGARLAKSTTEASTGTAALGVTTASMGTVVAAATLVVGVFTAYLWAQGRAAREAEQAERSLQEALKRGDERSRRTPRGNIYAEEWRNAQETTEFTRGKYKEQISDLTKAQQAKIALEGKHQDEIVELRRSKEEELKDSFREGWNLTKTLLSPGGPQYQAETLATEQKAEMLAVDQKISAAQGGVEWTTAARVRSLKEETVAVYAASDANKNWVDGVNPVLEARERELMWAKAAAIGYTNSRQALLASEIIIRPGHTLEDMYRRSREARDYSPEEERKRTATRENLSKEDENNIKNAYWFAEKQLTIQREFGARSSILARMRTDLYGAEAAKQAAIDEARLKNEKNVADVELGLAVPKPKIDEAEAGRRAGRDHVTRQMLNYNEVIRQSAIDQKYFNVELQAAASPWSKELQILIEAAKAYEKWELANEGLAEKEKTKQKGLIDSAAAHQILTGRVMEGAAAYQQFQMPLDRMMTGMDKLRQLDEAGGFLAAAGGDEGRAERALSKAMRSAYGQAHKQWQSENMSQQYEAVASGTVAASRSLYEYKMGSTVMPVDEAKKNDALSAANRTADAVEKLVDQGKPKLLSADL